MKVEEWMGEHGDERNGSVHVLVCWFVDGYGVVWAELD